VKLAVGEHVLSKLNLTTLDLAARYYIDHRTKARPNSFELLSNLKLGLGLSDGEQTFAHFSTTVSLHRELTHALDADLHARVGLANDGTPVFERPSFGASDTVRGFTRDDALGLRMWSLQPELWLRGRALLAPAPDPFTGSESRLRGLLRDSLSLALFYDVGGVYRTLNSPPGARSGPGAGLRFTYNRQATIKLDWAYGVGERAGGRRRLRFYLTFELPENPL
jgi:hemolysin activation/secretion protein